ncbi:uncharacterized protein LOC124355706 [Homalodisca vitripennis]|uniref:uncharacterized protein LOC124355706 n=1 Tax=Homalodisca vitripennis TaxID=197043 RepID=UPI001EEA21F8|nr:uncharacterized protein LOC124355706 [Homalodisca vitripennis]
MVRPIVEYASVVWSPHQSILINDLERIQTKFLRYLGVRTGFLYREVHVDRPDEALCLPPLAARRKVQDLMFLYKVINGLIDCPELLERVFFRLPSHARELFRFRRFHHVTNYEMNSAMVRMQRLGNSLSEEVDFFFVSEATFRRSIKDFHFSGDH